jgi:hypothetical protein
LSRLPAGRSTSAAASSARSAGAAARPRGVLVQSPKSDIYVVLLGVSLGAIFIATILMIVLLSRYSFSTKVATVAAVAPAASSTMLAWADARQESRSSKSG